MGKEYAPSTVDTPGVCIDEAHTNGAHPAISAVRWNVLSGGYICRTVLITDLLEWDQFDLVFVNMSALESSGRFNWGRHSYEAEMPLWRIDKLPER